VLSIIERQDQWWLCFGIYKQNWSTLFALMRETRVLKLELGKIGPIQAGMSIQG
jgi:tRNA(Glu) U13 pseudouridine synthase TruD